MTKTIRLDSLRKIQTWIGKQTGLETSISEAIEWLEKPENEGLKKAIERVLKIKVTDLEIDPQLMGALGAAEYARQKGMK